MTSSDFFRGGLVHHAPVPRKLSDRATLVWGVLWTVVSLALIGVSSFFASIEWDPLWIVVTFVGFALAGSLTAAVSRLDATLIFGAAPAVIVVIYTSSDFATTLAVGGAANFVSLLARLRHVGDAAEQTAYIMGSAMLSIGVLELLTSAYGWHEIYTVYCLLIYFLARFTMSTIRMSVVTSLRLREILAGIIPVRAGLLILGLISLSFLARSLQDFIATRNPALGLHWAGPIVIFVLGMVCYILASVWTLHSLNRQLQGLHAAAIDLPWSHDKSVPDHAVDFVRAALPHYEIEFRHEAGRNINEISAPMSDGHLIARRGSIQPPLFAADHIILDAIAHMGATMSTVRQDHDDLFEKALTDTMTRLPNYRAFMEVLDRTAQGEQGGFAVAYIDIDGFKYINDHYGHQAGNVILITLGARFTDHIRENEFVARVGGDEFVLVITGVHDEQTAHGRVDEVLMSVVDPVRVDDVEIPIVLSYGLSFSSGATDDIQHVVEEADALMYAGRRARRSGAGGETAHNTTRPRENSAAVARAISASNLVFAYQPIVDTTTGTIVALEALVRPGTDAIASLTAEQIIDEARCEGLLTELSIHLVKTSLADFKRFQSVVPTLTSLHVNIDVEQLVDPDFADALASEWGGSGIELTLELGESSLDRHSREIISCLNRAMGVDGLHVALDDFGRDSCTLQSIVHYPFDVLKIDQSMADFIRQHKARLIVGALVNLVGSMDARMVFEGVETDEVYQILRDLGVRYMQGYRFGKPLLVEESLHRFETHGLAAVV